MLLLRQLSVVSRRSPSSGIEHWSWALINCAHARRRARRADGPVRESSIANGWLTGTSPPRRALRALAPFHLERGARGRAEARAGRTRQPPSAVPSRVRAPRAAHAPSPSPAGATMRPCGVRRARALPRGIRHAPAGMCLSMCVALVWRRPPRRSKIDEWKGCFCVRFVFSPGELTS